MSMSTYLPYIYTAEVNEEGIISESTRHAHANY
jgi:hypothetical protein